MSDILSFPEFKVLDKHRELNKNIFIVEVKLSKYDKYSDRTILSKAHGSDGFKLSKFKFNMILSYLNNPTIEQWDKIYKFEIIPGKNLWDAWNSVLNKKIISIKNTENLSQKWLSIPDSDLLIRGIQTIIKKEEKKLLNLKNILLIEKYCIELKYKNFIRKYAWFNIL